MTEAEFREGIMLVVANYSRNYDKSIIALLREKYFNVLTGEEWMRVCKTLVLEGGKWPPNAGDFVRTIRGFGYGRGNQEKKEDRGERVSADEFWAILQKNAPEIYEGLMRRRNGASENGDDNSMKDI